MTSETEQKRVHDSIKDDNRDVADLWRDALEAYHGITGLRLERKFDNVDAMIGFGVNEMGNFHKYRHDEKKVDKLRSLFAANMDYIESGTQQLIGAATPSFPPAAAIGTAVTYMLSACRQVSADYDIVVIFFEDMNSFLQRIVILETRMPQYKAYHNSLMDVFTAFLTMCGFAHKYIRLGRFKKWIQNLMFGQSGELGSAREDMNTRLSRLQSATEFAILGNTEEIQKMTIELKKNQDSHTELLHEQRELLGDIQHATDHIRSDMKKLLEAFKEQNMQHEKEYRGSSTSRRRQPPSARRIRNGLPEIESDIHKYHVLKETLVNNTCSWIFSDPQWNEWMNHNESEGVRPVLALSGEPGMGKSHLAASVYDKLWELASHDPEGASCVAHFYFSARQQNLSSFHSAIVTVINQVVEQNEAVCQHVNAAFLRDNTTFNLADWHGLATKLLFPCFTKRSKHRCYIVLDGIDEVQREDLRHVVPFLRMVEQQELRISIFITSRPEALPLILNSASHIQLHVTREKQFEDLKVFVWNRLESLGELRKFGNYVKQRIAENLAEISPSMLHAEYMLARLNSLRREGAVLRNLERPTIPSLYDLYDNLFASCLKRFSSARQDITTLLLHLVAHSIRPLSLDEVTSLLEELSHGEMVDTRELSEVFTFFLQVGDPSTDAIKRARIEAMGGTLARVEELGKGRLKGPQLIYDDGNLPVTFRERSMQSFLCGSSAKWGQAHWEASEAHRRIFLIMARLAQPPNGAHKEESYPPIRTYAAQHVLKHWLNIRPERHSDEQLLEVMDVLWELLNRSAFADMVEYNDAEYDFFLGLQRINVWAGSIPPDDNFHLREDARVWWRRLAEDKSEVLLSLTKAHLRNLYQSTAKPDALKAFKALRSSLDHSGRHALLSTKAEENFPSTQSGDEEHRPTSRAEILGVPHLFADVQMDGCSYRAVAELMLHFKQRGPAETMCNEALKTWASLDVLDEDQQLESFKAEVLMVQILYKQGRVQEAYHYVLPYSERLNAAYISPSLKRAAYVIKARIEVKRKDLAAAAESFSTARAVDPSELTTGDILGEELSLYSKTRNDKSYMATLQSWTTPEQLMWMAWNYDQEGQARHDLLLNIAASTGEVAFVTDVYESVIEYLDNVNAGAPLRIKLAQFHLRVSRDLDRARNVLDQVFNSRSTGQLYAVTNYKPDWTFGFALKLQSSVLSELFRTSYDPASKQQLLEAMQSLTTSPLAMDVPRTLNAWMVRYSLTLAKMHLKMGPAVTFQTMLQEQINVCIEGLTDEIAWNDASNLQLLSEALLVLASAVKDGEHLRRASLVVFSAMFSHLTSANKEDEDTYVQKRDEAEDKSDDEEDRGGLGDADTGRVTEKEACGGDQPTADEGDIVKAAGRELACDGTCRPRTTFRWWAGKVAYYCSICACFLCSHCYSLRGKLLEGQRFCGQNHQLVKAPIKGWKGIKDSKLRIEGEEDIDFRTYLHKVRDELCEKAWKSFWLE